MKNIKLAIIGYGAMSELFHLPAAQKSNNVDVVGVYDSNKKRLEGLKNKFNIPIVGTDYKADIGKFDAAIVAVPNSLHSEISVDLMKNSKHVLIEKPMALSYSECQNMFEISRKKNIILLVGHIRRLYPQNIFIKKLTSNSVFGQVNNVVIKEGNIFSWPMASKSFINKEIAGGGVLIDIGVHLIDLFNWWFGELNCLEYFDDSIGISSVEADCTIKFSSKISPKIDMLLSRQRSLDNEIEIMFEKGILTCGTGFNSKLSYKPNSNSKFTFSGRIETVNSYKNFSEIIQKQIDNFANSIKNNNNDLESLQSAMEAVKVVEDCYNNKQQIEYIWEKV